MYECGAKNRRSWGNKRECRSEKQKKKQQQKLCPKKKQKKIKNGKQNPKAEANKTGAKVDAKSKATTELHMYYHSGLS